MNVLRILVVLRTDVSIRTDHTRVSINHVLTNIIRKQHNCKYFGFYPKNHENSSKYGEENGWIWECSSSLIY